MIPTLLARQLHEGLGDYLRTTFPAGTPAFAGLIDGLLAEPGAVFRGPYVSIGLPFVSAERADGWFTGLELPFPPYAHQAKAFARLTGPAPRGTLVATGTGSGKTESFLLPILEHCWLHRQHRGVKALLIYPMNALATDQARRLARLVHGAEGTLRGTVRAGLWVGESDGQPRGEMAPDGIITDKRVMAADPPDILLTNYKMLDILLNRPKDQALWAKNGPETLRFVAVDELHTFDGAQGTDLACLLRRLKARLGTPAGHMVGIGTSATLGGPEAIEALCAYARDIFGEPFDAGALVGEERVDAATFLAGQAPEEQALPDAEALRTLASDPALTDRALAERLAPMFFEHAPAPGDAGFPEALGASLRRHALFHAMLRALDGGAVALGTLAEALGRALPGWLLYDAEDQRLATEALLALVAVARAPGGRPFVQLRVQLWLRELRRMVASVEARPRLRFSADLAEREAAAHLPVVHCRECGQMGWAAVKADRAARLDADLKAFYEAWFQQAPDVHVLLPDEPGTPPTPVPTLPAGVCGACLTLATGATRERCPECGAGAMVPVLARRLARPTERGEVGTHDCPACEGEEALTILGAQAASLSSVLIGQLFAARLNDDKQLLTFSDSVQDAAHRASFFAARTHPFGLRTALAALLHDPATPPTTLAALPDAFEAYWLPRLGEHGYIAQFLPPDLAWLKPYEHLVEQGALPADPRPLHDFLHRRLAWDLTSELAWRARIGRTLEKSGLASVAPDAAGLEAAVALLLARLPDEVPALADLRAEELRCLLVGLVRQLRGMGAVHGPAMRRYVEAGCKPGAFVPVRYLPPLGPAKRPRFVASRGTRWLEPLTRAPGGAGTWFQHWASRCLAAPSRPLLESTLPDVLLAAMQALEQAGLVEAVAFKDTAVWGLRPEALVVHAATASLRCGACHQGVTVAQAEAATWHDAPCPRRRCGGRLAPAKPRVDYYARLYRDGELARIFAAEHTGLLERPAREAIEASFLGAHPAPADDKAPPPGRRPWDLNVLSCTPTLEMGIDIGDLSSVLLCSVPPRQASYLQRIGRAGRRDGNALTLTVANARPHDMYFFAEPLEMIQGRLDPPGVFLEAAAVLERQLTAYCLDQWVATGVPAGAVPQDVRPVLTALKTHAPEKFPHNFLGWVEAREGELLRGFFALFEPPLSPEPRAYLEGFMRGQDTLGGTMRFKIVRAFTQLAAQHESLQKRIRRLADLVAAREGEAVKALDNEERVKELRDEKTDLQALAESMLSQNLYGFLTDEGILPNYAFPEAGVNLHSVIYRRREEHEAGAAGRYERRIFKYGRAAGAALGELVPGCVFYAEGRRVEIDQVDMGVSEPEPWRFCPDCSYARLERADATLEPACPRCGAEMWADAGQRQTLLRIRQVFATTEDRASRATDQSDERERGFFVRNLLVDAPPDTVRAAFRLKSPSFPFGFEFLGRAEFRDVNFGESDRLARGWPQAGQAIQSRGFELCRHCGKVQQRGKQADKPGAKPQHTFACPARDKDAAANIVPAIHLYREFHSEALRLLLPVAGGGGEEEVKSLSAALHLGLSCFYRGSIDHLRLTRMAEPDRETGLTRQYLVLYDTVPGGTGYLKQLATDPEALTQVFRLARDRIRACACGCADPDADGPVRPTDGCYRCVLAYTNSRDMAVISRQLALKLLGRLLDEAAEWEPVPSLSGVGLSALSESVLEEMFLERLREAAGPSWRQDVVGGACGFTARFGERTWEIAQQVEIGSRDGVAVPCRADFVLRPRDAAGPPVVVFTDGFSFHRERLATDAAQRTALLRAGWRVFSLSYKDVEAPERLCGEDALEVARLPGGKNHAGTLRSFCDKLGVAVPLPASTGHSLALLLAYLARPEAAAWTAQALTLATTAYGPPAPSLAAWLEGLADRMPPTVVAGFEGDAFLVSRAVGCGSVFLRLTRDAVQLARAEEVVAVLATPAALPSPTSEDEAAWNTVLRAANVLQFLPGFAWLAPEHVWSPRQAPTPVPHDDPAWLDAVELSPVSGPLLQRLHDAGVPAPVAGYELAGPAGRVVASAELAWPDARLALVTAGEADGVVAFEAAGWRAWPLEPLLEPVASLDEVMAHVRSVA